jgi:uncharacterized membrane protein
VHNTPAFAAWLAGFVLVASLTSYIAIVVWRATLYLARWYVDHINERPLPKPRPRFRHPAPPLTGERRKDFPRRGLR